METLNSICRLEETLVQIWSMVTAILCALRLTHEKWKMKAKLLDLVRFCSLIVLFVKFWNQIEKLTFDSVCSIQHCKYSNCYTMRLGRVSLAHEKWRHSCLLLYHQNWFCIRYLIKTRFKKKILIQCVPYNTVSFVLLKVR